MRTRVVSAMPVPSFVKRTMASDFEEVSTENASQEPIRGGVDRAMMLRNRR